MGSFGRPRSIEPAHFPLNSIVRPFDVAVRDLHLAVEVPGTRFAPANENSTANSRVICDSIDLEVLDLEAIS